MDKNKKALFKKGHIHLIQHGVETGQNTFGSKDTKTVSEGRTIGQQKNTQTANQMANTFTLPDVNRKRDQRSARQISCRDYRGSSINVFPRGNSDQNFTTTYSDSYNTN